MPRLEEEREIYAKTITLWVHTCTCAADILFYLSEKEKTINSHVYFRETQKDD